MKLFDNVLKALEKEEEEDNQCREKYGNQWIRKRSSELTSKTKDQIYEYKNKIIQASNSDKILDEKIQQNSKRFSIFSMKKEQVNLLMPTNDSKLDIEVSKTFNQLKNLLSELDILIGKELDLETQIKEYQNNEDIQPIFLKEPQKIEKLINQEINKYDDKFFNTLTEMMKSSVSTMQKITEVNEQYMSIKGNDNVSKREKAIQEVYETINRYEDIKNNINEGVQYYITVQDLIQKTKFKVDDFCFSRFTEKNDLIANIEYKFNNFKNINNNYNNYNNNNNNFNNYNNNNNNNLGGYYQNNNNNNNEKKYTNEGVYNNNSNYYQNNNNNNQNKYNQGGFYNNKKN
jgi:programmed cell death 6-interacting protein